MQRTFGSGVLGLIFVVGLVLSRSSVHGLMVTVPAGSDECFYEELTQDQSVHFDFRVMSGGVLDIDVKVTDPDGNVLYEGSKENSGNYMFKTTAEGDYDFCFSNKMSSVSDKVVGFNIVAEKEIKREIADDSQVDSIQLSIDSLSEGVYAIYSEQTYLRARERIHRETAESSDSRMFWYSIFEVGVLGIMSAWQVWTLKRLFESKSWL